MFQAVQLPKTHRIVIHSMFQATKLPKTPGIVINSVFQVVQLPKTSGIVIHSMFQPVQLLKTHEIVIQTFSSLNPSPYIPSSRQCVQYSSLMALIILLQFMELQDIHTTLLSQHSISIMPS